ncbi:MAG: Y-family DNA polymerase [Mariniblastus sp.]
MPEVRFSHSQRILCLWFPNWPIQRLVVEQVELRKQRIILFRRDSRRGRVVSAASPLAIKEGVCEGMPVSEAKSLLNSSGRFTIFEHDLEQDVRGLETLSDSLEEFSPVVGLEVIDSREFKRGRRPNSLFLDVTGLAHLFGDETQLARQLLLHCDGLGYLPRIAIADTVGEAWGLARYAAGHHFSETRQPLVMPVAKKRDEIANGLIRQLPVESLRLDPALIDTLFQLGIENLGQLLRLSRDELAMRLGDVIHRRLDQFSGKIEEPIVARRRPTEFVAEQILDYPTSHRETIEVVVARLVCRLCEQLRVGQQGALEWWVRLKGQKGAAIEFRVNLFQPTAETAQVMPLIAMQLEQALAPVTRRSSKKKRPVKKNRFQAERGVKNQAKEKGAQAVGESGDNSSLCIRESEVFHRYTTTSVQEVVVSVNSHVLLVQEQRQLFDENPRLDRQALSHLINRLANRVGSENVVYPALLAGAQPEYAYRLRPLVDPSRQHRRRKSKLVRQSHIQARPLRLFRPPLPLRTIRVVKSGRSGGSSNQLNVGDESMLRREVPRVLWRVNDNTALRVADAWGPERIETGWWRGLTVCRDYWRIEIDTKQHFWVYRDLRSNAWFLHGEF